MKVSTLRLHSVKFKGGGELRVLHGVDPAEDRRHAEYRIGQCLDYYANQRIAGFAFIVWGADNASVVYTHVSDASRIPQIMVPDFARERLMADIVERWARD